MVIVSIVSEQASYFIFPNFIFNIFAYLDLWMPIDMLCFSCLCSVSLPHGAKGWSQSVITPLPGHIHLLLLVAVAVCVLFLPQGAMGWSAVCDCGISCSYSYFLEIVSIPQSQFYPQYFCLSRPKNRVNEFYLLMPDTHQHKL